MSIEINKPRQANRWIARSNDGSVLHTGTTYSNQVTTTGQPVLDGYEDENEYLSAVATWADQFPDLPAQSEQVDEGQHYNHDGSVVIARQSHIRTEHDPADVPALFLVARAPGTGIEWVEGERVGLGAVREYQGTEYRVIQAHVTQARWEPPNVPALWEVVPDEANVWQAGISVSIDDEYWYPDTNGTLYRVIQSHTTQAGWEPPNVPALWTEA